METLRRLGVARFWYEGNSFCLMPARREDFVRREWSKGPDTLLASRGTATELGGLVDFLEAYPEWSASISRCTSALPSGQIEDAFFESFVQEVLDDFESGGSFDAIYLSLHGASITDRRDAPEHYFLQRLRAVFPNIPIAASFDLHANHAPALADHLSIACGYRTYPHIDMRETALRTLNLLRDTVEESIDPVGLIRNEGMYLSSVNMRTDEGPMAELQQLASSLIEPPVLDISVFGGFAYANSENIGASVMAWADGDRAAAERVVDKVYDALVERRAAFDIPLIDAEEGIRIALKTDGLVAVTDASDNPLSGGIGDTPELLRALIAANLDLPVVFASFADERVVKAAIDAGVGASLRVSLGGQRTGDYGLPVDLQVKVERLTDGHFVNTGPMERGSPVDCGPSVVLRYGTTEIIVTTYVSPCNDPAFFALHEVDFTKVRLLCVKAKNHFRAAFKGLCEAIVDIDAPGPATLDLSRLKLKR